MTVCLPVKQIIWGAVCNRICTGSPYTVGEVSPNPTVCRCQMHHQFYRTDWSERRLFGALPRTSCRSPCSLVSDVGSPLKGSPRLSTTHTATSLASLSALAPSLLPLRSSLLCHATTCCCSSSCDAFIVSCPSNRSLLCLFGKAKQSRFLSAWVTARRFFQNLVAFAYTQRICRVFVPQPRPASSTIVLSE